MTKWLIALSLFFFAGIHADSWKTPTAPIPPGASTGTKFNVTSVYNEDNQTIVAAWVDLADLPYYAVFNGVTWTVSGSTIPVGASSGTLVNVILSYNGSNQTVIATWPDSVSQLPYYAVFDGVSWTTVGTAIPPGASTGVQSDIYTSYDANTGDVIAAWVDIVTTLPYYSVFDGVTWSAASTIPLGASTGVKNDVNLIYDPSTLTVMAVWANVVSPHLAYYAIFDGISWTVSGTAIPLGVSDGVSLDILLTYDSINQTIIAAWANSLTNTNPYYAVFDGISWTTPGTAIPLGSSTGVYQNISIDYNSNTQTVVAAWADVVTFLPYYSEFNGSVWTSALEIPINPSESVDYDILLTFNPNTNEIFASWGNSPTGSLPYFSLNGPFPPTNLDGFTCCNIFIFSNTYVNKFEWTAVAGSASYNIYRDAVFIAQAFTNYFNDALPGPIVSHTYEVRAVDMSGNESLAATITIP